MMPGGIPKNTAQQTKTLTRGRLAAEHVEDIDSGWNPILLLVVALFNYFIVNSL